LLPLLSIGVIALLCWGVGRGFGWRGSRGTFFTPGEAPPEVDALEILRRRYARGEIDGTTFDQMRERLEYTGTPEDNFGACPALLD
jgi:hypothetical protein